jgi:hypothetical protein
MFAFQQGKVAEHSDMVLETGMCMKQAVVHNVNRHVQTEKLKPALHTYMNSCLTVCQPCPGHGQTAPVSLTHWA